MNLPPRDARARWIALIYGAGLLVWLSTEDDRVLPVVLIGLGGALLTAYFALAGRAISLLGAALLGAGVGAGTGVAAALLMLLKIGMHAHPFPDYPPGLILDLLRRVPTWALAGALTTTAVALLRPTRVS